VAGMTTLTLALLRQPSNKGKGTIPWHFWFTDKIDNWATPAKGAGKVRLLVGWGDFKQTGFRESLE